MTVKCCKCGEVMRPAGPYITDHKWKRATRSWLCPVCGRTSTTVVVLENAWDVGGYDGIPGYGGV